MILRYLREWRRQAVPGALLTLTAPSPDLLAGDHSGRLMASNEGPVVVRSLRTWLDLAELIDCRMLMPQASGFWATFRFQALDPWRSPHHKVPTGKEKYGVSSRFALIEKQEEPWFTATFMDALRDVRLARGFHVLDLGCNRGDVFALIREICGSELFEQLHLTGVDHAPSALKKARERFPGHRFLEADIQDYQEWSLPPSDLLLCLGTLQSPGLQGKNLFPSLFKTLCRPGAGIILAFPNVRYLDGELSYGARMKNYRQPELSLLVKDLFHYRRYLQKCGYRVRLHGKYDIFLVAEKP